MKVNTNNNGFNFVESIQVICEANFFSSESASFALTKLNLILLISLLYSEFPRGQTKNPMIFSKISPIILYGPPNYDFF